MIVIIVLIGTVILSNSYEAFDDRFALNVVLVIFAIFMLIAIIIVYASSVLSNVASNSNINRNLKSVINNMPNSNFANSK
jgi:predicted PurR-regulated permease PerM